MSFYGNQVNWVPMRWDGNEVYINGVNIKNYSLGEKIILNDSNNSALGDYTIAAGTNTAAGSNAFKILAVDKNNLTMTLNSVNGLTVGLECSCQYDKNFDMFGTITAIDTENNIVTFSVLPSDVFTEGQTNVLWVPSHPELGDGETFVGTGATSFGHNNISSQSGSFAAGGDNIAAGKYSATFGDRNKVGYASFAAGQFNVANQWSLVGGYKNTVTAPFTFAAGNNNTVSKQYASALGNGNTVSGEAAIAVNGSGNTASGTNSFAGGTNSQALGTYCFAFGNGSISGNSNTQDNLGRYTTAIGFKAKALLDGATAIGWEAEARNKYSAAFGIMTRAVADRQFVCGTWNNLDTNALFLVGNGTGNYLKNTSSTFNPNEDYYTLNSDGKTYTKQNITAFESGVTYYIRQRSNAFTVKKDGSAEVKTMGDTDNSVATKKYVDSKEESGTWTPKYNKSVSGITVSFSNSTYYRVGSLVNIYTCMKIAFKNVSQNDSTTIFDYASVSGLPFTGIGNETASSLTDFYGVPVQCCVDGSSLSFGAMYDSGLDDYNFPIHFVQIDKGCLYEARHSSSGDIYVYINITYRTHD